MRTREQAGSAQPAPSSCCYWRHDGWHITHGGDDARDGPAPASGNVRWTLPVSAPGGAPRQAGSPQEADHGVAQRLAYLLSRQSHCCDTGGNTDSKGRPPASPLGMRRGRLFGRRPAGDASNIVWGACLNWSPRLWGGVAHSGRRGICDPASPWGPLDAGAGHTRQIMACDES